MPNTKAVGVAYSDPEFESVTLTGGLYLNSSTVAATGSAQADAAALSPGFNLATDADAAKGVILPAAAPGLVVIVKNADAANAVLKVYPATGDAINAIAANGAYSMAAKTCMMLVAYDSTTWYTLPLLAS
jgi:hypothetical protein